MNKRLYALLAALILIGLAIPTVGLLAQQPPEAFNDALKDLSNRVGRTLTLRDFDNPSSRWAWRGVDFSNSALDCPTPGEAVTAGKVIGYQFIFVLRGRTYDYRVPVTDRTKLRLCTNASAGAKFDLPTVAAATANTQPPDSINAALADLNKRLNLNLTFADFDAPRSRWSWRYREFTNSQLNCPAPGQATDQIITPGWIYTFVYQGKTYEYRVALRDPSTLFLCRGG
jgi:hypothetical protein